MPFLSRQRLTMLVFFLQPVAFGGWLPRIPDVQHALGLGPAALAVALLGLPCGTLLTLPFAGPIMERIGAHRGLLLGFPLHLLAVCLPVLAPNQLSLFLALVLTGGTMSFVELALNVTAAETEKATGALIMSTSHGFWSLGIMTGSLVGSGFAGLSITPAMAIPIAAVVTLPIAIAAVLRLPSGAPHATSDMGNKPSFQLPSWALLAVCLFVIGITMTEGAMADWSAVFMRNTLNADAATAGLGYTAFALVVALGRLVGDRLRARWGAMTLARVCGVLAVLGVAVLVSAPNAIVAYLGFGIIGIGVSVGFPLGVSAAAALPGSASQNVAVLSFVALTGFLIGPPLIGFVAEHVAMRVGLAVLIPALLISLAFTSRLRTAKGRLQEPANEAKPVRAE